MGVRTYSYYSNEKLSTSFVVSEFRCKCGKAHNILVSTELVEKLEALKKILNASKVIITSGYRCSAHDIAVKGNGRGQHTKGTAADCIFYDKSGKPISTKLIACKAQDLGFNGIGNIDSSYTAIHLDVRTGSKWYGDEVKGTSSSVTNDYYSYYGIKNETAPSDTKELQQILNNKGAKLDVDGIVGPKTISAVKKFIIEKGDRGDLTKWVQKHLNNLGYNCGAPDGIAGENTMKAIYKWQADNHLGQGYLGGSDWNVFIK